MATKLWPFRPDWESGVLERLEWLTDLMGSTKGAEQRRPQRFTPRRTLEVTFLPHGTQRSKFDLLVMEKGNDDWYIPLWFDVDTLKESTPAGQTAINTPYEDREFTAGGYAVIRPPTSANHDHHTFVHEFVKVTGIKQNRLIVERGQLDTVALDWPRGSEIYPVRLARFTDQPSVSVVTANIVSTNMKFTITEPNEWYGDKHYSGYGAVYGMAYGKTYDVSPRTPAKNLGKVVEPKFMPVFENLRVMNSTPDYNQDMNLSYDRLINVLDNSNGIPAYQDALGFATPGQQHTWFLRGRGEQAAFRTMLYYLRGRVRPVWVPTFNDDVQLIAPSLAGQNWIDIQKIGYTDGGKNSINRQCLAIQKNNGEWIFQRITGTANVDDHERLELGESFAKDLNPEDVYKISFMAVARLDQDGVEINHVTDNMGLAKSVTTFRVTPELRQYVPWAVTWPPTWRGCDRECASMPRVEEWTGFGLPNEDWEFNDVIATAQYANRYAYLGYSHKYDPADVITPEEFTDYFAWFSGGAPGQESWRFNLEGADARFLLRYFNWSITSRAGQLATLYEQLPSEFMEAVENFDDAKLFDFFMRYQMYFDYNTNMEAVWSYQIFHKRNWLPFRKLTEIQQSCSNNMLGRFCVQSVYTRSSVDRYPTNARGSHTLYSAGSLYQMVGVDEDNWPTDLSDSGQSYTHTVMPYNGNGLHSSCGCLCLQFIEQHDGLRSVRTDPNLDPELVMWWHRAVISWLTPAPWPTAIRLFLYDSITGQLVRTLDLDVINYPVSGYADEFTKMPWQLDVDTPVVEPEIYHANLVMFRRTFGKEEAMTTFHPDPWDNIWNIVPLNSKGFIVEVYPR